MKLFSSKKRIGAIGAIAALTLVGGGVAYGYWTSTGSGTGQATTASPGAVVAVTQTDVDGLAPGVAAKPLPITVTATVQDAYVAAIKAYVTTNKSGCTATDYLINGLPVGGTALAATAITWTAANVHVGSPVSTSVNTISFNDLDGVNQNACQGAAVTINYVTS